MKAACCREEAYDCLPAPEKTICSDPMGAEPAGVFTERESAHALD